MASKDDFEILSVDGHDVRVSHPGKLYFSREVQVTKLDLVQYFLSVSEGAVRGVRDRPIVLKRFVNGAEGEPFYQKRAPSDFPEWMRTVTLRFPSGRTADEMVVDNAAGLVWVMNLGCMELHPHPVRTGDLEHPDQLRIDLDPGPGVGWEAVQQVAVGVRGLLEEVGLVGWVKTSGSRGMHINVPIEQRWGFAEVRRAALAMARAVERRMPGVASSKWWKEERQGVFLDYNQNAKDRTTASAYSVRPLPDARVSAPIAWDEVMVCDPAAFTVRTMPARFAEKGDLHAGMGDVVGSLDKLLEMAARDEAEGMGDAPWPPHFAKAEGEGPRVTPSKARASKSFAGQMGEGFGPQRFRRQSQKVTGEGSQVGDAAPTEGAVEGQAAAPEKRAPKKRAARTKAAGEGGEAGSKGEAAGTGRRRPTMPLVVVAKSPDQGAAMQGLERWKERHPEAAALLAVDDVLVDRMRGRAYVWYRVRVNLRHVPAELRPEGEAPDPDDEPSWSAEKGRKAAQKDEPPKDDPQKDEPQ